MTATARKLEWNKEQILEEFRNFPLFDAFSEAMVSRIADASEIIHVPKGTEVLKQGQNNDQLYFLSSGQVGVYVDGNRVSKMQHKGDLLGEMSVITNKPAGATLLAEGECTLVRVDSEVFLNMEGPHRDLYLSIIYRIYATVLAEKLYATNQKAKHFEEMNAKLTAMQWDLEEANRTLEKKVEERTQKLETQKAELMAGKNKMEELLNSKKFVFQKLSEFNSKLLPPLKDFLDDFRNANPKAGPAIDNARRMVFEVQRTLEPLTDRYETEQAIQSKRVLLADTNKKQQIVAKMALGGTGVVLDLASSLDEAKTKLSEGQYDLIVFDTQMLELGNLAREKNPGAGQVLMTSEVVPKYLPELKKLEVIPHIVSRNEEDRVFTVKNIMTTVTKILSRDLFGLEKYLSWGVDVQSRPITSSNTRGQISDDIESYFTKLGIRRANRDRIRTVVEEMLMNAIYDAPVDETGKSLYNHLSRTVDLQLKPEEQGVVRFATDGMLIAVSVADPFGSLKGSTILKYLEHNYAGDAADLNAKLNKGGAGRGLHQIVENSDLVVFNVDPGKRTEAIAIFNVEAKEAVNQNPSFHLFVRKNP